MFSSDSDDSIDSLIGVKSSKRYQRHEQEQTQAALPGDDAMQRVLHASLETFQNEQQQQSLKAAVTRRGSGNDDDDDDDDSVALEVLPPQAAVRPIAADIAFKKTGNLPRSGNDKDDPVMLLELESDSDDSSQDLQKKRATEILAPLQQARARKRQAPPIKDDVVIEVDDSDSSVDESPLQQRKHLESRKKRSLSTDCSFSPNEDSKNSRKTVPEVAARPPTRASLTHKITATSLDFSSSDDDPPRKPAPFTNKVATAKLHHTRTSDSFFRENVFAKAEPKVPSGVARKLDYDSTHSDSDDDSSDDSLQAIKRILSVRRKPMALPCSQQSASTTTKNPARKSATTSAASRKQYSPSTDKEDLVNRKQAERLLQQEARLQAREDREAAKEAVKLERVRQREEKKAAIAAEKEFRKCHRQKCAQAAGRLAKDEIAVLLERDLFRNYSAVADLEKAGYLVQEHPSAFQCNAVQWIRNDSLRGGADTAVQKLHAGYNDGYQHLPVLAIVFHNPQIFLQLLERADRDEEDDYPLLEMWVKSVECGWRAAWKIPSATSNQRPRIFLLLDKVLEALDKLWIQHQKKAGQTIKAPPTAEELHDAITWMLIQFQVECVLCCSGEEISNHLCKMTRLLAEKPYQKQVTELECIKKLKAECSDMDPPLDRAKDCWLRQLQQVPRISRQMALNLTCYYPTALSLWTAYRDESLTVDEKRMLTAGMFSESTTQAKLSCQLYTVMTSDDPNEILR